MISASSGKSGFSRARRFRGKRSESGKATFWFSQSWRTSNKMKSRGVCDSSFFSSRGKISSWFCIFIFPTKVGATKYREKGLQNHPLRPTASSPLNTGGQKRRAGTRPAPTKNKGGRVRVVGDDPINPPLQERR